MFALVFCVFVSLTITQVSPSSCDEDPCWRPPPAVLPESEGVSEGEAVETLLCSLACEDSTSEVSGGRRVRMARSDLAKNVYRTNLVKPNRVSLHLTN